jgi:predicted RNase H-like HicB family nuclease
MASIREVPGAISQGRTRTEARDNVIDALRLMLSPEPRSEQDGDADRELLPLSIV